MTEKVIGTVQRDISPAFNLLSFAISQVGSIMDMGTGNPNALVDGKVDTNSPWTRHDPMIWRRNLEMWCRQLGGGWIWVEALRGVSQTMRINSPPTLTSRSSCCAAFPPKYSRGIVKWYFPASYKSAAAAFRDLSSVQCALSSWSCAFWMRLCWALSLSRNTSLSSACCDHSRRLKSRIL